MRKNHGIVGLIALLLVVAGCESEEQRILKQERSGLEEKVMKAIADVDKHLADHWKSLAGEILDDYQQGVIDEMYRANAQRDVPVAAGVMAAKTSERVRDYLGNEGLASGQQAIIEYLQDYPDYQEIEDLEEIRGHLVQCLRKISEKPQSLREVRRIESDFNSQRASLSLHE